jgi:hypothetical protein
MKLLSDIINELVDLDVNLNSALLKTKVLAARIENTALAAWVDNELNGYARTEPLPAYRIASARISMNYMNGNMHAKGQPVPMAGMETSVRDKLENVELRETVATLQSYTALDKGTVLSLHVPSEVINYVDYHIRQTNEVYRNFAITSLLKQFSGYGAVEVLAIIRSRLLTFMLQIEKEFGSTTDIEALKAKNQLVTNIMYNTINNTGDGNTVNTGNSSMINATISISKGDFVALERKLYENGLQKADIDSLKEVIFTDPVDLPNRRYGPEVNKWLKKMLDKAIDGSWQIGIGTAGGVLAELINAYYGM